MSMKTRKLPSGQYFEDLKKDLVDEKSRKIFERELHRLRVALMIAKLRKSKHVTQYQLAKALSTNQSAVARMESGKENFTIDTLSRVAKVLHRQLKIEFV